MTDPKSSGLRLFRESFVPVVIIILGLFLILLYVQFRAEYDADEVTVIDIQPVSATLSEREGAVIPGESEPIVASGANPDQQRATALMAQGKWSEAEKLYLARLAHNATHIRSMSSVFYI